LRKRAGLLLVFTYRSFCIAGICFNTSQKRKTASSDVDRSLFSFRADKMVTEGVPTPWCFIMMRGQPKRIQFISFKPGLQQEKVSTNKDGTVSFCDYYSLAFPYQAVVDNAVVKSTISGLLRTEWLCLAEDELCRFISRKKNASG